MSISIPSFPQLIDRFRCLRIQVQLLESWGRERRVSCGFKEFIVRTLLEKEVYRSNSSVSSRCCILAKQLYYCRAFFVSHLLYSGLYLESFPPDRISDSKGFSSLRLKSSNRLSTNDSMLPILRAQKTRMYSVYCVSFINSIPTGTRSLT